MNNIEINEYLYFDVEHGRFYLTSEAQEIIYREKDIISSYSGSNNWCNHFVCELIDLYSGASKYNYCIDSVVHEKSIPVLWKDEESKNGVIKWIDRIKDEEWGKHCFQMFKNIIDDLVPLE